MLKIEDLRPEHTGRRVVYRPSPNEPVESGVITSWNGKFVFVRYDGSNTSQATNPADLSWETP